MPDVTLTVPEHLETRITRLVEEGESLSRQEAVENLLSTGITAYKTSGRNDDDQVEFEDDGMMGHEEQYVF